MYSIFLCARTDSAISIQRYGDFFDEFDATLVEREFDEDTVAHIFDEILVEDKIAERVVDRRAFACAEHGRGIYFVILHDMRMRADDGHSARVDESMRKIALILGSKRLVLYPPVRENYWHEARYFCFFDVLLCRRRGRLSAVGAKLVVCDKRKRNAVHGFERNGIGYRIAEIRDTRRSERLLRGAHAAVAEVEDVIVAEIHHFDMVLFEKGGSRARKSKDEIVGRPHSGTHRNGCFVGDRTFEIGDDEIVVDKRRVNAEKKEIAATLVYCGADGAIKHHVTRKKYSGSFLLERNIKKSSRGRGELSEIEKRYYRR